MKKTDFYNATQQTPFYVARFRIIKVSRWMNYESDVTDDDPRVVKGDIFHYNFNGCMISEKLPRLNIAVCPSMFKFLDYKKIEDPERYTSQSW